VRLFEADYELIWMARQKNSQSMSSPGVSVTSVDPPADAVQIAFRRKGIKFGGSQQGFAKRALEGGMLASAELW